MAEAELAALLDALPERPFHATQWLDGLLRSRWSEYVAASVGEADAPARMRAWSVGCVMGTETLVQSRPLVRDDSLVVRAVFLRTSATCTIAMFATTREASRPGNAAISRFQRWIGACSHDRVLDGDKAIEAGLRAKLRAQLPDFLERSAIQEGDDELLFFSFLARLHELGGLGSTYADSSKIRDALTRLSDDIGETLGEDGSLNMMVYDGRCFGVLHGHGTMTRWEAPAREARRHQTGPIPAAGIPRGAALFVLSRGERRDPVTDPLPRGVFTVDPADPLQLDR